MNFEQPKTHVIPWKRRLNVRDVLAKGKQNSMFFHTKFKGIFEEDRHSGRQTFSDENQLTRSKNCWFSSMIFERWLMAGATGVILNNL